MGHSFPAETVALHTDPFYAECRAYGRIQEAQERGLLKRQIAIRCEGFLLLSDEDRNKLQDRGVDFEEGVGDGDGDIDGENGEDSKEMMRQLKAAKNKNRRPVRAMVKELACGESGVDAKSAGRILRDIRQLNRLKIYNRDIRKDNFRGGKLVDFGSSWTEPHCFLEADEDEAAETKAEDLVMFDEMVAMEALRTDVRALPNWQYCSKLRPRKAAAGASA
ncbi:hypothetical protein CDD83_366 [Cordyceps sp. RAO-2017]|nr:hypothetical protein CDD83_366 [Cordyceps sp. RAO-2017]